MTKIIRRLITASLAALILATMVLPASATVSGDPNDAKGKLDIKSVDWNKTVSNGPVTITITFFSNFRKGILKSNRVYVYFRTDGTSGWDYKGTISLKSHALTMKVVDHSGAYASYSVSHAPKNLLVVTIPNTCGGLGCAVGPNPNGPAKSYVFSWFQDDGKCSHVCKDRAPDSGWIDF